MSQGYVHVYVSVGVCVCECMCVHMHVEVKGQLQVSFLERHLPCLGQGLLVARSSLTILDWLVSKPPQHWDYRCVPPCPIFYVDVDD